MLNLSLPETVKVKKMTDKEMYIKIEKTECDSDSSTSTSASLDNSVSRDTVKAKVVVRKKRFESTNKSDQFKENQHKIKSISNLDSLLPDVTCKDHINSLLSCRFCRKEFDTLQHFSDHDCRKIIPNLKCNYCTSSFSDKHLLNDHVKNHKRNNCTICNAQFTKRQVLCNHLKTEHNIWEPVKFYPCSFCDKYFSKKLPLYHHLKSHLNNQHLCLNCGFICDSDVIYNDHMKKHINISKYECKLCGKKFMRRQQHDQHMMGHERYSCSRCDSTFPTKKLFLKHQSAHGIYTVKKYACPICSKRFQKPKQLKMHQRTHTGEMPVKCFHCDKSYCNNKTLSKHMKTVRHIQRVNTDEGKAIEVEKSFLCSECGARFYRRTSLLCHIELVHSASEPVKCPHCEYNTKCKQNLKRHIEKHTNIKRFICEICGSSFRALATLKEHHAFVHSENRHFTCNVCNKGFKNKSTLKRHMRIHSEVRAYNCQCGKKYKRMSHLKRHMASAHDMAFKSNRIPKSAHSDMSKNHQDASPALHEAVPDDDSDDSSYPASNNNICSKVCDSVESENSNKLLSDKGDIHSATPSSTMQIVLHYIRMISHNDSVPVTSPISLQSDYPSSVPINDSTLNLSLANYCNFDLPSSPIDMENVASILHSPEAFSSMDAPFQTQTSNIDSFVSFSLQNSNSPTAIQKPPFLLHGDISSPSHVNDLNVSKQLFGESDILSYSPHTPPSDPDHLFNSARDIDLWDTDDTFCRLKLPDTNQCANHNFSPSLSSSANNILPDNLLFSHDSLNVCSLDSSVLNAEFDSLSNLC